MITSAAEETQDVPGKPGHMASHHGCPPPSVSMNEAPLHWAGEPSLLAAPPRRGSVTQENHPTRGGAGTSGALLELLARAWALSRNWTRVGSRKQSEGALAGKNAVTGKKKRTYKS